MRWKHTVVIFSCLSFGLLSTSEAEAQDQTEDDTTLLIMSSLIGEIDLPADTTARETINAYYELLSATTDSELSTTLTNLNRRTEDYQVAFRSGDTAELNEIVDELVLYWAAIRSVHIREFAPEVVALLESAYAEIYPFIQAPD